MIFPTAAKILPVIREKIGYDRMGPQEKLLVGAGGVFLILFLVFQLIVFPYFSARQRLARSVKEEKAELAKIVDLQRQYRRLQGADGGVETGGAGQGTGFSLFSFVEEQAVRADIKQQIVSMKPSTTENEDKLQESIVEIKLQRISLGRLVAFLKLIEGSEKMVFVHTISIQDSARDNLIDVTMQIATVIKR